jgi:hypothetical protein
MIHTRQFEIVLPGILTNLLFAKRAVSALYAEEKSDDDRMIAPAISILIAGSDQSRRRK